MDYWRDNFKWLDTLRVKIVARKYKRCSIIFALTTCLHLNIFNLPDKLAKLA